MPEFEIYRDNAGEYRWRLQAANGEIVAASEGYTTASSARRSVERVKELAPQARVNDKTDAP